MVFFIYHKMKVWNIQITIDLFYIKLNMYFWRYLIYNEFDLICSCFQILIKFTFN